MDWPLRIEVALKRVVLRERITEQDTDRDSRS